MARSPTKGKSATTAGAPKALLPLPAMTTVVVPPLHTSGNEIIDANGQPVMLRGVVLEGLEMNATAPGVTQEAVQTAKDWGANIVRVPLGAQYWVLGNCEYDPAYAIVVNDVVNWITSLGMIALLDLHYTSPTGCEDAGLHNMADENESPTFWKQVASKYASNPLVAFELFNEPHNISDQLWLDGGTTTDAYGAPVTYEAAGMQQLYDTVRSTGAGNLVFVGGTNWASTPPLLRVAGTNIVYVAHAWTCPNEPPPQCTTPNPYDPPPALAEWIAFSATEPVVVDEFGWPRPTDGQYNTNLIADVQAHRMGWVAFQFEQVKNPNGYDLVYYPNGAPVPTASGQPVLNALKGPP
ncbi:MAG: cellulase family glycosylhydrolase [Nitrososphaerales archaeon]